MTVGTELGRKEICNSRRAEEGTAAADGEEGGEEPWALAPDDNNNNVTGDGER